MKKILSAILIILLLISCGNNTNVKRDYKMLKSQKITIPNDIDIEVLVNGKDTVINDFMDSELKVVIYTDSISCNTCSISTIANWTSLLDYAKTFNNQLKYYFIFTPKKNDDYSVRFALKTAHFDYPVILDTKGEFEKLNPHLPENKMMHTFLLDKDNNVIMVGNPLNSIKMEELFKKTIEEILSE